MKTLTAYLNCLQVIAVLLLPIYNYAQLTVTSGSTIGLTPQQFVQTYLVGEGVAISNATFNGSSEPLNSPLRIPLKSRDQIGSFSTTGGATLQIGLDGGVILSTGFSHKAVAGNGPSDNMWMGSAGESDPDLQILSGGSSIHDKAILEFDFIPQNEVVSFRYCFGSIEFDGFCSTINDAFGLFLSGPGIAGGMGFTNDAVNIALLPETNSYVNITNICAADNGNLGFGVYSWWNSIPKLFFSYNRITYVFTASHTVQCGATYHMKFAIGDASDGILDSGVFLEQNSFASNIVTPVASFTNPPAGDLLIAGCNNVLLNYSIPQPRTTDLIIETIIHSSGTATQADILPNPFPAQIIIPAGQLTSPTVLIQAIPAAPGPDKTLVIQATTFSCGVPALVYRSFTIKYNPTVNASIPPQTLCTGNQAIIATNVTGGQPFAATGDYQYLWNTGATTASLNVSSPPGSTNYTVTVTDACNLITTASTTVDVGQIPAMPSAIAGEDTLCTPVNGLIYTVDPLTGADSYTWSLPAGAIITSGTGTSAIIVDFTASTLSGQITVFGHNNVCGDGPERSLTMTINPSVGAAGPITGPTTICTDGEAVDFSIAPVPNATSYEWSIPPGAIITSGSNTPAIQCLFPAGASSGLVTARGTSADCGPGPGASLAVAVSLTPGQAGIITGETNLCTPLSGLVYSIAPVPGADTYNWNLPTGATITAGQNTNAITVDFSTATTSENITVAGISATCGQGAPSSIDLIAYPASPAAGPITGPVTVCQGDAPVRYSITPLAFTTLYEWSVPAGVSIIGGTGTEEITCIFTTAAVSGAISVRGYNNECLFGAPSQLTVTVNPLPASAGTIVSPSGAVVCQNQMAVLYSVPPIPFATTYSWNYSGTGVILNPNNNEITIGFLPGATPGILTVTGQNNCGNGIPSIPFVITVNPMPVVSFTLCGDTKTTKNGRPLRLHGGLPIGAAGIYSGPGVTETSPGTYAFDPSSNQVTGGGSSNGIAHTITYRFTNNYGCYDEKSAAITVYASNAVNPCPGTVRDVRDDQIYPTFMAGTGINQRCWMAANLNFGTLTNEKTPQTDDCVTQKYCLNNIEASCSASGGFYQWDELMGHTQSSQFQDICPPGWHVPTGAEWQLLIDQSASGFIPPANGMAAAFLKDPNIFPGFQAVLSGIFYLNNQWSFTTGVPMGNMFWTSETDGQQNALAHGFGSITPSVSRYWSSRGNAFSVRCVRN